MPKNKYFVGFGTVISLATPIIVAVSCTSSGTTQDIEIPNPDELTTPVQTEDEILAAIEGNVQDINGQWKFIIDPVNGLQRPNENYVEPVEVISDQITVVEENRQQVTQHDLSKWEAIGMLPEEIAIMQQWTDDQLSQFTRLVNWELVGINGIQLRLWQPDFETKDSATEISAAQRAYDIVVANGIGSASSFRPLVSTAPQLPVVSQQPVSPVVQTTPSLPQTNPIVQTPPPLPQNNGPQIPPEILAERQILVDFGVASTKILVNPRTEITQFMSNGEDVSTWTPAECAFIRWYNEPTPPGQPPYKIDIYKVRTEIKSIKGPATPQYISGPFTRP